MNKAPLMILLTLLTFSVFAQELTEEQLMNSPYKKQYFQRTRDAMVMLSDGKLEQAINYLNEVLKAYKDLPTFQILDNPNATIINSVDLKDYLNKYPEDAEALFGLALAYSLKDEFSQSNKYVQKALNAGLPPERFLAGPKSLAKGLYYNKDFQNLILSKNDYLLIHGPTLTNVTPKSAEFWIRTRKEMPVKVAVHLNEKNSDIIYSKTVRSNSKKDYTAVLHVDGLKPKSTYNYNLFINNKLLPQTWTFTTFPEKSISSKFQVGFGGGASNTPWHEIMWTTIASHNLAAFLFMGDNVYIDHPFYPEVQRYCYYCRQSRKEFRDFAAITPIYAIYDDHDFSGNDSWGGPQAYKPEWKVKVWNVFKENWNNPYYGGGYKSPGCWFNFSIADVDFFMLDCRYYRDDPNSENPSMLGEKQKTWLFNQLKNSKATFKVIASSVPWTFEAKIGADKIDTWFGYKDEREEIFSFLDKEKIEGVILISADRHRSDIWKIERNNGYNLYEFMNSRLTNAQAHLTMPGSIYSYNEKNSFGVLHFDTTLSDPSVSFIIYNIDNERVYEFKIKHSELTY